MDIIFLLKSLEAVLETVFLCLAIWNFLRGLKTKNYQKAAVFFGVYLILNAIRTIVNF